MCFDCCKHFLEYLQMQLLYFKASKTQRYLHVCGTLNDVLESTECLFKELFFNLTSNKFRAFSTFWKAGMNVVR